MENNEKYYDFFSDKFLPIFGMVVLTISLLLLVVLTFSLFKLTFQK